MSSHPYTNFEAGSKVFAAMTTLLRYGETAQNVIAAGEAALMDLRETFGELRPDGFAWGYEIGEDVVVRSRTGKITHREMGAGEIYTVLFTDSSVPVRCLRHEMIRLAVAY